MMTRHRWMTFVCLVTLNVVGVAQQARIVYVGIFDNIPQLCVMGTDGSNPTPLGVPSERNASPRWSPDGTRIVYHDSSFDVWVVDADGSNARKLIGGVDADGMPAWSPDGSRISYVGLGPEAPFHLDIWTVDTDGEKVRRITNDAAKEVFPVWSPDGSKLAYSAFVDGAQTVCWVELDSGEVRRVVEGIAPSWSPDGSRLAYVPARGIGVVETDVWSVEIDTGRTVNLTNDPAYVSPPVWLKNGEIAFLSILDRAIVVIGEDDGVHRTFDVTRAVMWSYNGFDWYDSAFPVTTLGRQPVAWGSLKGVVLVNTP